MKHIIFLSVTFFAFVNAFSQQLKLDFDLSNAEQTISYMRSSPDRNKIDQLLKLPATKGLLRKIKMDSATAVKALLSVHDTALYTNDYQKFQYGFIKKWLTSQTAFIKLIKDKQDSIKKEVITALVKYIPPGKDLRITVCFLLGGNSSGFTLGDDSVFYIGTHQYRNDITGIIESCKHELFHNIQSLYRQHYAITDSLDKNNNPGLAYVHFMLVNLFLEGSAEYVADLRKVNNPDALFIKNLREHAEVNDSRSQQVFYLVSKLLVEVNDHPDKADQDHLYNILFDWNWNNPGYYTGYIMTRALCNAYGENALLKYLGADPSQFIYDYIQLTRQQKDKYPLRFTEDFEKVIESMVEKIKGYTH